MLFWYICPDIREMEHVPGRSINLALSVRGRAALRMVDIEDEVCKILLILSVVMKLNNLHFLIL